MSEGPPCDCHGVPTIKKDRWWACRVKQRESIKRYKRSPKGKAARSRYGKSEKGRATQARYVKSAKGQATRKRIERERYENQTWQERHKNQLNSRRHRALQARQARRGGQEEANG